MSLNNRLDHARPPSARLPSRRRATAWVCCAAGALAAALGCRQAIDNQPRYEPLEPSTFFHDGRSSRHLVPGTVPRGFVRHEKYSFNEHLMLGRVGGELVDALPTRVLQKWDRREVLQRGQERYRIFCVPCHDLAGTGNGMVPQRGFPFPPSYHSQRLREAPLGHFFEVATTGLGRMPAYGKQIPPEDRWAIAAYIRALQLSQHAPVSLLEPDEREKLPPEP